MHLDPRIGYLSNGQYYAFVNGNGWGKEPFYGTLEEVEIALGLRQPSAPAAVPAAPAIEQVPALVVRSRARKPATRRKPRNLVCREYRAMVTCPGGSRDYYRVLAFNKTEARKLVRRQYREDTPSPRYGFYSFEQCRLEWIED
ncbi:hypothetical protein ACT80S_18620 [Ramlibacter sp. MAHUQ-53]|uniref:hypothetical protein n=1 Tax=unclassified Ramlibacter TaxID=2617605 RepID=UPI00363AE11F